LETLVERQGGRITALEERLEEVQGRVALCPCGRSSALGTITEASVEVGSEGLGDEEMASATSRPVSMTAVGSFRWGSDAGTVVAEPWGQEEDEEEEDPEDEDLRMAHQIEAYEQREREREALEWLAANPTEYKPEAPDSSFDDDVDRNVALFPDLMDQ